MSAKQQKRQHVNTFICIEMADIKKRVVEIKNVTYLPWSAFVCKIDQLVNDHV